MTDLRRQIAWRLERFRLGCETRRREALRRRLGLPDADDARRLAAGLPGVVEVSAGRASGRSARIAPEIVAVTIATAHRLPMARVLARSFGRHHPEIPLHVLCFDPPAGGDGALSLVPPDAVGFPDSPYLALKFDASQLSRAAKPYLVRWALTELGARHVLYLDSDLCFYSRAESLLAAATRADFVVTPHLRAPYSSADKRWEFPHMGDIALRGVFNAGLFAARRSSDALRFLDSWGELSTGYGAFDPHRPHQTEQTAFNFVSTMSESVEILRDPAYNVAYWNLHERSLHGDGEGFTVDGAPLVAFHFSGYEPAHPRRLSRGNGRHSSYHHEPLARLVEQYAGWIREETRPGTATEPPFTHFPSGIPIDVRMRNIFKRHELELDCGIDPFTPEGEAHYAGALLRPVPASGTLCPILLSDILRERPDMRANAPHADLRPDTLWSWFAEHGAREHGYARLFDAHRSSLLPGSRLESFGAQLEPFLEEGFADPLGRGRSAFLEHLESSRSAHDGVRRAVRSLSDEIYAGTRVGLVRRLLARRVDLRAAFPKPAFESSAALAMWIETHGETTEGLPHGTAEAFRRSAGGRALARVFAWMQFCSPCDREATFAFVGLGVPALMQRLLPAVSNAPFDLEDLEMLLWTLEEEPWRGVPLVLELSANARDLLDPPTRAGEAELLAPVLPADPRFAEALESYRRARPGRYADERVDEPADPSTPEPPGIHLFGFGGSPNGLGTQSREAANALRTVGCRVTENVFGHLCLRDDLELDDALLRFEPRNRTNLFVSYPHLEGRLLDLLPRYVTAGRRNVVHLAWEQSSAPKSWARAFDDFDDIWAISRFAAESLGAAFDRPVRAISNALDTTGWPETGERRGTPLPADRFVVSFLFDAASSVERKNPEGAIDAFAGAFRRDDAATLWMRVGNARVPGCREQLKRIYRRARATGLDIRFDFAEHSRHEILRLIGASDAYLSLHRSEGFGYTCAEAMALGVPTLATNYSGNLDFMTRDNSFLVDAVETEVLVGDGAFVRGSRWGEPDIAQAAALLRFLHEDRDAATRVARIGREEVRRKLHPAVIGAQCAAALGFALPDASEPSESMERVASRGAAALSLRR